MRLKVDKSKVIKRVARSVFGSVKPTKIIKSDPRKKKDRTKLRLEDFEV